MYTNIEQLLQESVTEAENILALNEELELENDMSTFITEAIADMLEESVLEDGQEVEDPESIKAIDDLQFFTQDNLGTPENTDNIFDVDQQTDHGNMSVSKDNRKFGLETITASDLMADEDDYDDLSESTADDDALEDENLDDEDDLNDDDFFED